MDLRLIEAIKAQNSFALRLCTHLVAHGSSNSSNIAFSPLSIHSLLSLLTSGSTGPTRQQILSFLGTPVVSDLSALYSQLSNGVLIDGSATGEPCLRYASGVWVDTSTNLKKSFRKVAESVYKAEAKTVPFHSMPEDCRNQINKWVEQMTAGHIKDLIPPASITVDTRVVLGNAIYFKGLWPQHAKFNPRDTKINKFYLMDGSSTETPFMASKKVQYISAYDGFKVLKLPYKQVRESREFSFYMFLPDTLDGLPDLSKKLSTESDFLDRHIPMKEVRVKIFRIPKFKISMEINLKQVLTSLGLVLPFQITGDFLEMVDLSEGDNYYVSDMIHKCVLEVNEEGTEAAASSMEVRIMGTPVYIEEPIEFVADHPFLFLIREDSAGVVLFVGHLLDPSDVRLEGGPLNPATTVPPQERTPIRRCLCF